MLLSDKYPFITNYFTQALISTTNPLPQSILFYGNDLNSQYILANEIARLLNCRESKSDECNCLNCRWIRENVHPEVRTISRIDNKPENDESKTVISIKQTQMIKETLMSASDYHRVFIFCDKDEMGTICGLNQYNFQAETANSLLKIIEEPQPGVTFIFLTRYIDDILPTILSRSQCFFVPAKMELNYDYSIIDNIFTNYWDMERRNVFDISQQLTDLSKDVPILKIIESLQYYILTVLKSNPHNADLIEHIRILENAKKQVKLGMRTVNIFDEICLSLIK